MVDIDKCGSIGIFDSGVGGLTVLSEVARLLPNESIIYYADAAHCPYGGREATEIVRLTKYGVEQLLDMGAKIIIIACNTATAYAIESLRAAYDIPFVAIEPAVKPAIKATKSGKIAVLATKRTLSGDRLDRLCATAPDHVEILRIEGRGFVELVEADREQSSEADAVVDDIISPLLESGVDQIVLGCTHYPFLSSSIRSVIRDREVAIINPAEAVAARAADILHRDGLFSKKEEGGKISFINSLSVEYNNHLKNKLNKYVK